MNKYVHVVVYLGGTGSISKLSYITDEQYVIIKKFAELVRDCAKPCNFNTIDELEESETYRYYLDRLDLPEEDKAFADNNPYYLNEYLFDVVPYSEEGIIKIETIEFLDVTSIEEII